MNYFPKYLKYKNKYQNLKKNLINKNLVGGTYDDIICHFLLKHKESLTTSEFFRFLLEKTQTQLDDLSDANVRLYVPYIIKLNEYIYSKLSDESKAKSNITIFSYATGNGIVEALFALFLTRMHHKLVNIVYFDVFNFTELLRSYGVFNNIVGFNQRSTNILIQLQLRKLLSDDKPIEKLSNMYKKFPDNSDISIDLFIANNPQGYKYNPKSKIDKLPKMYPEFRESNINININIRNVYNYIKILTTPEQQKSIPMLWFIWGRDIDMDKIEESLKQIYDSEKIKKQYNINSQYALSTLDNINQIFEIEES
jgi:hypothetical protein